MPISQPPVPPPDSAGHAGGASRPRAELYAVLAASRIRYARKHRSRLVAALDGLLMQALIGAREVDRTDFAALLEVLR